jgi:hypothetical protein
MLCKRGEAERMIVPCLSRHLNAGLKRMGNIIQEEYREYFILNEEDNAFWVQYNQKLKEI